MMPKKLKPKLDECVFVGYPEETKRYYFYLKFENKIIDAKHVTFLKKEFLTK